jgi:hypothetical protein
MKFKSKLDGTFTGVGELLKPFDRILPNIGAIISTVLNGTDLNQKLLLVGGSLPFSASDPINSSSTVTLLSFDGDVSTLETDRPGSAGAISKFTGVASGTSWSWSELNATTSNSTPFNGEDCNIGTAINRILFPRAVDSPTITSDDVELIAIDQANTYFHAAYVSGAAADNSASITSATIIAQFEKIGSQFGE